MSSGRLFDNRCLQEVNAMKKIANFTLVIVGLIIILFAVFCPSRIAEVHSVTWRLVIGLLGCFSLVSGMYKMARNN